MKDAVPDIGALRHRVILEQEVLTPDVAGSYTRSWSEIAEVWAAIDNASAKMKARADQSQEDYRKHIIVRFQDDYRNTKRVRYGARCFVVETIEAVGEQTRFLKIMARETS